MTNFRSNKWGFTLIEVMITMVIMTMIAGAVSTIYFSSLQVWRRCSSQSQADPPAHLAIDRMTKELKNAYLVDNMGANTITFTLPLTDSNGVNIIPLQSYKQISYYISDSSGTQGHSGTTLWRKQVFVSSGTTKLIKIAENVESLSFSYDATSSRVLTIYAMSITVLGREGREQYESQFGSHVAFRNGPVT